MLDFHAATLPLIEARSVSSIHPKHHMCESTTKTNFYFLYHVQLIHTGRDVITLVHVLTQKPLNLLLCFVVTNYQAGKK